MFCNRCGSQMPLDSTACPGCGRPTGDPASAVSQSRIERHLHTLGILWMVIGGLFLIPALGLMIFGRSGHFVFHHREPWAGIFPLFLFIAGSTLAILAAGGVCVGLGLMQRRPWARATAIILGVLALFHPPFGTALGIYTLWVLVPEERANEYRNLSRTAAY
jgi:hypothetical protein